MSWLRVYSRTALRAARTNICTHHWESTARLLLCTQATGTSEDILMQVEHSRDNVSLPTASAQVGGSQATGRSHPAVETLEPLTSQTIQPQQAGLKANLRKALQQSEGQQLGDLVRALSADGQLYEALVDESSEPWASGELDKLMQGLVLADLAPDAGVVHILLRIAHQSAHQFPPNGIAFFLQSLATLNCRIRPKKLGPLVHHAHMSFSSMDAEGMRTCLTSLAKLGYFDDMFVQSFAKTVGDLISVFHWTQVADILWALATMSYKVSDHLLMTKILTHIQPALHELTPPTASNLMWAIGTMQITPPFPFMTDFAAAVHPTLHQYTAHQLRWLLWGLSLPKFRLPPEFLADCVVAAVPHLETIHPQGISSLAWTVRDSYGMAPDDAVYAFFETMMRRLPNMGPKQVSMTLWARLHSKVKGPPQFIAEVLREVRPRLDTFKARRLGMMLYTLWREGEVVPHEILDDFVATIHGKMDSADCQSLGQAMHALAGLGYRPKPEFISDVVDAYSNQTDLLASFDISNLLSACATIGFNLHPRFVDRMIHVFQQHLGQTGIEALLQLLSALSQMNVPLKGNSKLAFGDRIVQLAPNCTPSEALALLEFAPKLGISFRDDALHLAFATSILPGAASLHIDDLAKLCHAIRRSGYRPTPEDIKVLEAALEAQFGDLNPTIFDAILWSFPRFITDGDETFMARLISAAVGTHWFQASFTSCCDTIMFLATHKSLKATLPVKEYTALALSAVAEHVKGDLSVPRIPYYLCRLLWSCVVLEHPVPKEFIDVCVSRIHQDIRSSESFQVSRMLWSLAKMQYPVSDEFLADVVALVNKRLSSTSIEGLAYFISGLSGLGHRQLPDRFLANFVRRAKALWRRNRDANAAAMLKEGLSFYADADADVAAFLAATEGKREQQQDKGDSSKEES